VTVDIAIVGEAVPSKLAERALTEPVAAINNPIADVRITPPASSATSSAKPRR
jgi:hypothetical protein